jgi:hypothetical protein
MYVKRFLICVGTLLLSSHFSATALPLQSDASPEKMLQRTYDAALKDASVPTPAAIVTDLTIISNSNPSLVWDNKHTHLLVVTWKNRDTFQRYYQNEKRTSANENSVTWVTAVPEVQKFCQQYFGETKDDAALNLRLKEYLGLHPSRQYDVFVEMWVRPSDLFRPCPDPEISDSQCRLELSDRSPKVRHIKNYNDFYRDLYYKSFRSALGVPWTGLGYTYDWGNPTSKKGNSEFVLVPKAAYAIRRAVPTAEYCSPN